ncbi:MAG: GNAT family N-acetyltransferase [Mycobacteriales bacterium]
MILRELTEQDVEQSWMLGRLAFGGERGTVPPPPVPGARRTYGAFTSGGALQAQVVLRPCAQWWGGREVSMVGIAGVAVRPEARGAGLVGRLLALGLADHDEALSVLFPTAPGIYRRLGWELVGSLDRTCLRPTDLPATGAPGVALRAAVPEDADALAELYARRAATGNGLLARRGPGFPHGAGAVLQDDVCTVAVEDGTVTGYVGYRRDGGYTGDGVLRVTELLAAGPGARLSLVAALRSWSAVVDTVRWRGSTSELAALLGSLVPVPESSQPWMLRVLDPVRAVQERGFAPGTWSEALTIDGTGYRLEVDGGRGMLTPGPGGPSLSRQGFALLFAGVSGGRLPGLGHADAPVPALEAAFCGPAPEILDYF